MTTEHDCSGFTAVKTATENEERRKQIVEADIANIEQTIRSGNISQMESVHISIEGKYGAYILILGIACMAITRSSVLITNASKAKPLNII